MQDLPDELLLLIAASSEPESPLIHHSLLSVNQRSRDALLGGLTCVCLHFQDRTNIRRWPALRLLHRACAQAAHGLAVELHLGQQHAASIADFLHLIAVEHGGWPRVQQLKLVTSAGAPLILLGPAVPALRLLEVDLQGGELEQSGLLHGLQVCTTLSSLHVLNYTVGSTASGGSSIASAMAVLKSLKQLSLHPAGQRSGNSSCSACLAQQLTGLSSLQLSGAGDITHDHVDCSTNVAAGNQALQVFSISSSDSHQDIHPLLLHYLFATCKALTTMELATTTISHASLEVLLEHGTYITSLTAWAIETETSVANRQCSWRWLALLSDHYPSVLHLAHLPLRTVTALSLGAGSNLGTLQLPSSLESPTAALPSLLRHAAANLAACPAWTAQAQRATLSLTCTVFIRTGLETLHAFSDQGRVQLLEALAPLVAPQIQALELSMQGAEQFQIHAPEITAIGHALGPALTSLTLKHCTLKTGGKIFGDALQAALPALDHLHLAVGVPVGASWLYSFLYARSVDCSSSGSLLTVMLDDDVFSKASGPANQGVLEQRNRTHVRLLSVSQQQQQQQQHIINAAQ